MNAVAELGEVEAANASERAWVRAVDRIVRAGLADGLDYMGSAALRRALNRRAVDRIQAAERAGEAIDFDRVLGLAHRDVLVALA